MDAPSYRRTDQPIPPRLADVSGSEASPRSSLPFPDDGVVMGFLTASRGGPSPTSTGATGTLPIPPVTSIARPTRSMVSRVFPWTLAFVLFAASTAPMVARAATISLATTTISECVQTTLTWTGGSPPYKLKISPLKADGNSDTSQLQQYSDITTASFSWTANFTAGTRVQFDITDADGDSNGDPPLTVAAGPNANCLPAVSGSSSSTGSASATGTGSGGSAGSTASGSPSPNTNAVNVSRTGLSGGAIAGIAVGVGVLAVLATTLVLWCLLKRFLLKHPQRHSRSRSHHRNRTGTGTGTDTPSSSSSADEVRMSWYQRAARRVSLRGQRFDIDRPVARSPTFSSTRSPATSQRGPLLPVSAYNGISSTLAGTGVDPFRAPTPTDSVIVSGPSSPVSDRGEAGTSFRRTPSYSALSHLQQSTTSLEDTQSQTKKARRPAHAHNTSDTSTRSGATATSTTELRTRTTSPALSTSLSQSSGDRESRRDRDTSTLASTISTSRPQRAPRSPRHETDAGIRLLGGPTGLEAEGEGGNVGVVVRGEPGEGAVTVVTGSPPPYSV